MYKLALWWKVILFLKGVEQSRQICLSLGANSKWNTVQGIQKAQVMYIKHCSVGILKESSQYVREYL